MPQPTAVITPLNLHYLDGSRWTLLDNFIVVSETLGIIRVPLGFDTDFNSIPRGLWNVLPPDAYGEAGVVHDYLYRTGKNGTVSITRAQADLVHREFVHYDHPPLWKERAMYWGLRLGGWVPWNAYRRNDPT